MLLQNNNAAILSFQCMLIHHKCKIQFVVYLVEAVSYETLLVFSWCLMRLLLEVLLHLDVWYLQLLLHNCNIKRLNNHQTDGERIKIFSKSLVWHLQAPLSHEVENLVIFPLTRTKTVKIKAFGWESRWNQINTSNSHALVLHPTWARHPESV